MKCTVLPWTLFGIALAVVLGIGIWCLASHPRCDQYKYLDSELACGEQPAISKANYITLSNDIDAYIATEKQTGKVSQVSVYFRDLENGPTFSSNAGDAFAPASLLKLPVVLAVMALSEDHPEVLDQKLLYSRAQLGAKYQIPVQVNFDFSGEDLLDGGTYTVRDLMRAAIVYSDNVAYYAVIDYMNNGYPGGTDYLLKSFQELGVIDPRTPQEETVTVRDYSSLFRLLYNASYLNAQDSELVLSWLAESSFDAGLQAGVPKGIVVASKFGECEEGTDRRLHDCGIIYFPNNPYALCVMTAGTDWAELKKVIGDISGMVYKEVDKRAKQ